MNMIEKVARAIADRRIAEYGDYAGSGIREVEYAYARAALEAMKIPTAEMLASGCNCEPVALPSMSDAWAAHTLRVKYAAMILAALRGDEGSDNVG